MTTTYSKDLRDKVLQNETMKSLGFYRDPRDGRDYLQFDELVIDEENGRIRLSFWWHGKPIIHYSGPPGRMDNAFAFRGIEGRGSVDVLA